MGDPLNPVFFRLLEWVLTFTAHSTLFLVLAGIFCRFIAQHSLVLREMVWRTAVLGALFTASIQIMSGVSSWKVSVPVTTPENELPVETSFIRSDASTSNCCVMEHTISPSLLNMEDGRNRKISTRRHSHYRLFAQLFLGFWITGIAIGLLKLIQGRRALSKLLQDRIPVDHPMEFIQLSRILGIKKAPELTESTEIFSPLVVGIIQSEICLPKGLLRTLPNGERIALLAHETAHIVRRDPLWRVVYRILRAVFFFNPLLVRSLHSLELIAEFLCDQTAAACTGNSIGLARCILQFAQYSKGGHSMSAFTSALSSTSSVGQRIRRLLQHPITTPNRYNALAGVCLIFSLIVATCMFPTIACSRVGQSMETGEIHGREPGVQRVESEADTSNIRSTTEVEEESERALHIDSRYREELTDSSDKETAVFEVEHAALIEEIEEAARRFEVEHAEEIRHLEEAAKRIATEHEEQLRLTEEEVRRFEVEHAEEIRHLEEAARKLAEEHGEHIRLAEEAARRFEEEHAVEIQQLGEAHDRFKEQYGDDFEQDPELLRRFEEEHAEEMRQLEEAARQFEIQQSINTEVQWEIQRRLEEEQAENLARLEEAARRFENDVDLKIDIQQKIQQRIEEEMGEEIRRLEEATLRFEEEQSEKFERLEEAARDFAEKHGKDTINTSSVETEKP